MTWFQKWFGKQSGMMFGELTVFTIRFPLDYKISLQREMRIEAHYRQPFKYEIVAVNARGETVPSNSKEATMVRMQKVENE